MADTAPLHALVYSSKEAVPLSPDALRDLLTASRRNNESRGITGMLIYGGGTFAQYLEGPKHEIDDLVATIQRDKRHRELWQMAEGPIQARIFPDWSMSYRAVTLETVAGLPGNVDRAEALRKVLDLPASSMMTVLLKSLAQTLLAEPDKPDS